MSEKGPESWLEIRKKKEAEGWVVVKLNSNDPNWSPEHPGDFFRGDWCWRLVGRPPVAQDE